MMAHLVTTEYWIEAHKEEWKQEGISIGEKRGISIGEKRGISIGEKRGEKQGKLEVARAMLAEEMPLDKVAMFTGFSTEELEGLK